MPTTIDAEAPIKPRLCPNCQEQELGLDADGNAHLVCGACWAAREPCPKCGVKPGRVTPRGHLRRRCWQCYNAANKANRKRQAIRLAQDAALVVERAEIDKLDAFMAGIRQRAAAARQADPANRGRRSERKALKGRCPAVTAKGKTCGARARFQGYCGRHSAQANLDAPAAVPDADAWIDANG